MRYYIPAIIFLALSCSQNPEMEQDTNSTHQVGIEAMEPPVVRVQTIEQKAFQSQVITNGKVKSIEKADLKFRIQGYLSNLSVTNGSRVTQGQIIAQLDDADQKIALLQAKNDLEQAKVDMRDLLIQYGSKDGNDTSGIAENAMRVIKVKSGYNKASTDLKRAELNLRHTILKAPFGGIIANLKEKENNYITGAEVFCTIIGDKGFEVEFPVIEKEALAIDKGQSVSISPFISDTTSIRGKITEINPVVDENGLVSIKARIYSAHQKILDGMNVKIKIEQMLPDQLVIPKEALVIRSGKEVVFTYENGVSIWNYVKVGYENDAYLAITEGLKEGDKVIIAGNLNLAHDAKVRLE